MKQLIKNYSFAPSSRQITFTDFTTINLDRVLLITNVTSNTVIYQFNSAAVGGSAAGNVLTLTFNSSAMSSSDHLQIFYDAASGDPLYDSPQVQGNVASGSTDSGNPVKVGGKYNASGMTLTGGMRGDLQLDASGRLLTNPAALANTTDSVTAYDLFNQPGTTTATWSSSTSTGSRFSAPTVGYGSARLTALVTGSPTAGQITFEGNDGTNYFSISAKEESSVNLDSTYNVSNGSMVWVIDVAGWQTFDVKLTSGISGGTSPQVLFIFQLFPGMRNFSGIVGLNAVTYGGYIPTTSAALTSLSNTVTAVKTSPGQVGSYYVYNSNTSAAYVQLFDATTANVTLGTTVPNFVIALPAGQAAHLALPVGWQFSNAISVAATSTPTGGTAPGGGGAGLVTSWGIK